MRPLRLALAVPAALAALALPPATAMAHTDYVVTLEAEPGPTCEPAIAELTSDAGLRPTMIYTDSLCAFAVTLTKPRARELALDPRVRSVVVDGTYQGG